MQEAQDILTSVLDEIATKYESVGVPMIDWPENFPQHLDDVLRHVELESKYRNGLGPCPLDPLLADFTPFDGYIVTPLLTLVTSGVLKDVGDRITRLTGLECKYDTIKHEIDPSEYEYDEDEDDEVSQALREISLKFKPKVEWKTWWCPELKLAFYTGGMFLLPTEYQWLYTDITKGSTYARRHCEFQLIRERIRMDQNIMMFEIPRAYNGWNADSRKKFVDEIIHHYTHKMPFVGGAAASPSL